MKQVSFLVVVIASLLHAQIPSVYSRYGLGNLEYSQSVRAMGFGNWGTAAEPQDFISSRNPASLNRLTLTRVEFGSLLTGVNADGGNASVFLKNAFFSGFTFAVPLARDHGVALAFGLHPYSTVKYNVERVIPASGTETSDYYLKYGGEGGISKIFLASSWRLPFGLAVGASLDYFFGKYEYSSKFEFTSGSTNAEYRSIYKSKGIGGAFGLITPNLASGLGIASVIKSLQFSASVNTAFSLDTDTSLAAYSSSFADTISGVEITTSVPARLTFGIAAQLSDRFTLLLDYVAQDWTKFTYDSKTRPYLRSSTLLSAGFEIAPQDPAAGSWNAASWRGGISYEQAPYVINGKELNMLAVSGGFSFPLGSQNSLDVALSYGMRGETSNGLIKEHIFRLGLGLSLGELWFQQQER